jgi:hypothetical protein
MSGRSHGPYFFKKKTAEKSKRDSVKKVSFCFPQGSVACLCFSAAQGRKIIFFAVPDMALT